MENNNQEKKNETIQNPSGTPKADMAILGTDMGKKKGFSFKLFAKLIVVSILIIAAVQLYSFDSNKGGSETGLGSIIKSIVPDKTASSGTLSNADIENIIKSMVPTGTTVAIKDVTNEAGLYKLNMSITGQNGPQDFTGFLTLDGKKFFPQAIDVAEAQKQVAAANSAGNTQAQPKEVVKTDKPKVELFVMSHCPFGTQIEKGILPVVDLLKNKIDFAVKFVSYSMHGQKEINEELNQYCIQKEQTSKFNAYLKCFLSKENNTDACIQSTGINTVKLKSCIATTDKTYKITEKFNDKSTWSGGKYPTFDIFKEDNTKYGVQGSPTLIINGTTSASGRDSNSLLSSICSAFTTPPAECSQQLSTAAPSAGFGYDAAASTNSASCGN